MNAIESPTEEKVTVHTYILDPLSTIIKLCILSKKEVGCKISISNNIINLNEVGVFQSLVRYVFNNNKVEVQYLYNPIEFACAHFLSEEAKKRNPKIVNLFENAQKGLSALIETYKNFTIIVHALYLYKNIISNYLGGKYNDKLFIKDNISVIYNKELVEKLNHIWNEDRIRVVLDMIKYIDKEFSTSVKFLEEFMLVIDKEVYDLIQNN